MNTVSIVLAVIIAAVIVWAGFKVWKNRGKCSGCSGDCSHCTKKI